MNQAEEADPDHTPGRGVFVLRNSVNNHQWYGMVTNLEKTLSDAVTLSVGADLRRYTGSHFREVRDFLGASGYAQSGRNRFPDGYLVTEAFEANPWKAISSFAKEAPAGQRIAYNNDETITYSGIFGQLEYASEKVSTYIQGAVSNQGSTRFELFKETEANKESEKINEIGYNIKTGLSYLFDDHNSFFVNTGYYQRQPFFDNQFLNFSNTVNPVTVPEDIFGLELGYKYVGPKFVANLNLYRTSWKNRTTTSTIDENETVDGILFPEGGFVNITKLNQLHTGVEFDFSYDVNSSVRLKGYTSVGSWKYQGTAIRELYEDNLDRTLVSSTPSLDIDGIKVGGAAQTTFGIGVDYKMAGGLRADLDWNYYNNLYSNLGASTDELKLPSFSLLDFGLSYAFDMNNGKFLTLRANIYNVLGEEYISRAFDSDAPAASESDNWNGVNKDNRVAFGKTRTWNVSAKYSF